MVSGYNEVRILARRTATRSASAKDELVTEEEVDEAYAKASTAVKR